MFVDIMRQRNPQLIAVAADLHRSNRIPSNCFVIDADAVGRNAEHIATLAARFDLTLYQMTKQFGRNPCIAGIVARRGIPKVVAVDSVEANLLSRAGLSIGHLGHLVQTPTADLRRALAMGPDLITVFSYERAALVARAAVEAGREQRLLLRVVGRDDTFYPGQRGGIPSDEVVDTALKIEGLDGVTVVGVTSFPCVLWDEGSGELRRTPNLQTITQAAEVLRSAGIDIQVINAPSATCCDVLPMLAEAGATQAEPGSALIGQTPLHAISHQPEVPAMVYVSELSHTEGDIGYSIAGGLYARSRARKALIFDENASQPVEAAVRLEAPDTIDYYGTLDFSRTRTPGPGATVVYAFRAQVFVSRSFVAVVTGIGSAPVVEGVYDRNGYRLNDDLLVSAPGAAGGGG